MRGVLDATNSSDRTDDVIANGGSDSKGMCVLCSEVCVFREFLLLFQKTCEEEEKRKEKEERWVCFFLSA